jgi:hypothetical protein
MECPNYCPHLDEAAERAVRKVFAILGVDINVPKEVEEFRENLRFGSQLRMLAGRGAVAMFVVICTALVTATWVGIKVTLGMK